jgi:CubicO group peptidase (beta-lactamase class C family)
MKPGETDRVLDTALAASVFTAATAEVGNTQGRLWQYSRGRLALGDDTPVAVDTIFDLASLTKVLATTTLILALESRRKLDLDTRVASLCATWKTDDRRDVTVRDLLEHASGLPGHRPYYLSIAGRSAYEAAIAVEPLEYAPRARAVYSDLGFMLIGFLIADIGRQALDDQFARWLAESGAGGEIGFGVRPSWTARIAATEDDAWRGRLLRGEVHDENAEALGGVAGHAGLFGTAAAVGAIARWWLARLRGADDSATGITAARACAFARRSDVPGSSRALGWDTMLPTSSCGTRWSASAIGHTGFTGTSLWIDPPRDRYAVLLTNRVHPTRANDRIAAVRRDFHDAVVSDFVA